LWPSWWSSFSIRNFDDGVTLPGRGRPEFQTEYELTAIALAQP
jgi:hypothetical protein